ncbi:MAG: Holliday junction branch migration protein RuvA [Bifidobacteriaceae bacterium]|nr:Holliday junction branch migration protein RuvA [Bifidobacteriaceae bacterium]
MIGSIRGRVLAISQGSAVIETGGVGLVVLATPSALAKLRLGEEAFLTTLLVVREDALTLYGFADDAEKQVFEAVQTVSGIGPKIAMAVLAAMSPAELSQAVAAGNLTVLQKVPGIGRKGASRLCLELAGKLTMDASSPHQRPASDSAVHQEVAGALVALGWNPSQAEAALNEVAASEGAASSAPEVLRAALRVLGARHG